MPFPSSTEVISALSAAVEGMLPPVDGLAKRWCSIFPLKLNPSGIGGITGYNPEPAGDIFACRLEAMVRLDFEADSEDHLHTAVGQTTLAVATKGRSDLNRLGILKLKLTTAGERAVSNNGQTLVRQSLEYFIVFEYQKIPSEAEGVISSVPIIL